jgi:hypothetical protein
MGLQTEWGAWQLDELCAIVGAVAEGNVMNGKPALEGLGGGTVKEERGKKFRSPKHLVKRKVKIKADGTW